jgi:hypothetical protein
MGERLKFVARLLDGEKMAVLCREFDIARKNPRHHPQQGAATGTLSRPMS